MDKKEALILNDFSQRLLFEFRNDSFDIFGGLNIPPQKVPIEIEEVYRKLYEDYPDRYRELFAFFHQSLNNLFEFMNHKMRTNRHYNADESRSLISVIDSIESLTRSLYQVHVDIHINKNYGKAIESCKGFLSESGGSTIPDSLHIIHIERYTPVFKIIRYDAAKVWQAGSLKKLFGNDYMNQEISEMTAALEDNPARAISKAKNMLETCCKTILDDKGRDIPQDVDLPTLVKETKKELKQSSVNPDIKQILGGISGVATGIAKLRNHYGEGHGQNMKKVKTPSKIEAALAVDSSIAVARFLWSLHQRDAVKVTEPTKDNTAK